MEEAGEKPAEPGLTRRDARPDDAALIISWFPARQDAVRWGGPSVVDPLTADWLAHQFTSGPYWVWTDQSGVIQAMAGLAAKEGGVAWLNRFAIAPPFA